MPATPLPKRFGCPFNPDCDKSYSRKDNLKDHLIAVKAQGGDPHHVIDDVRWFQDANLLRKIPRPKRTPEEQKELVKARHARYYKRHKEQILMKTQSRRSSTAALRSFGILLFKAPTNS